MLVAHRARKAVEVAVGNNRGQREDDGLGAEVAHGTNQLVVLCREGGQRGYGAVLTLGILGDGLPGVVAVVAAKLQDAELRLGELVALPLQLAQGAGRGVAVAAEVADLEAQLLPAAG